MSPLAGKRSEQTRARILEVAMPLFAARGLAGTTTRMVAEAAQVNVATLSYHFQSKEGLYQAVIDDLFLLFREEFDLRVPEALRGAAPVEVIAYLVRVMWHFSCAHRTQVRLLQRLVIDQGVQIGPYAQEGVRVLQARADALIALFRPEWPPHWRGLFLVSFVYTVFRYVLKTPEEISLLVGDRDDRDEAMVSWLTHMAYAQLAMPAEPALFALRRPAGGLTLPKPLHEA